MESLDQARVCAIKNEHRQKEKKERTKATKALQNTKSGRCKESKVHVERTMEEMWMGGVHQIMQRVGRHQGSSVTRQPSASGCHASGRKSAMASNPTSPPIIAIDLPSTEMV